MSLMQRVADADGTIAKHTLVEQTYEQEVNLRNSVYAQISSERLSDLVQKHPQQAKSEIRSVCMQIFSEPEWAVCGEERREYLIRRLIDSVFGLGIIQPLIDDPYVTEIMVNATKSIYFEKLGKLHKSSLLFASEDQIRALIDRIVAPLGRRVDESSPMVDARLPDGHRVNVVIPPIAVDGPIVTIRKFTETVMTLNDLTKRNTLTPSVLQMLYWAVRARKNVVVSGGTGSGKTTLLNAMSCEIEDTERIVTIEDSAELRFLSHPHVVRLEARANNAEGKGAVSIRALVANALRMRPDRIIVGECRGQEALDMLQAMNTGHDGSLTTLHANSADDMVLRLATMVRFGGDLPMDVVETNIASAIDLIVHIKRSRTGERFVSEIAEPLHISQENPCEIKMLYKRQSVNDSGTWMGLPLWIDDAVRTQYISQKEVDVWLGIYTS